MKRTGDANYKNNADYDGDNDDSNDDSSNGYNYGYNYGYDDYNDNYGDDRNDDNGSFWAYLYKLMRSDIPHFYGFIWAAGSHAGSISMKLNAIHNTER